MAPRQEAEVMNAGNWIELGTVVVTVLGGGGVGVAKLTRIAVAVENLIRSVGEVKTAAQAVTAQVQDHEVRLSKNGM
jgi:uncharacterized membrane protein